LYTNTKNLILSNIQTIKNQQNEKNSLQTTEELFSREGLSLNAYHYNFFGGSYSKAFTYYEKDTLCGENILVYYNNQRGTKLYLAIEDKKVYLFAGNCNKNLIYDFGLEIG